MQFVPTLTNANNEVTLIIEKMRILAMTIVIITMIGNNDACSSCTHFVMTVTQSRITSMRLRCVLAIAEVIHHLSMKVCHLRRI